MADHANKDAQRAPSQDELVSQAPSTHRFVTIRAYLVNILSVITFVVWTVSIAYIAYIDIPLYTDNGYHTGTEILFKYDSIRAISFTSEDPVTLQIGEHKNDFLFVNTDDGSVAQSSVVSATIHNMQGQFSHEFGPAVVSEGHWRRVGGDDYDNDPYFYLTSDSVITLSIYPAGSVMWVWIKGIVLALVVWFGIGLMLVRVLSWAGKLSHKLLGRYRKTAGS